MRKFLIIIVLALLQCACATPEPAQHGSTSLLSFEAISAEISVSYQNLEVLPDASQTVAQNFDD